MNYPHIAQRLFNRPHLIAPDKALAIMGVLAPRLGITRVVSPDGSVMQATDLGASAIEPESRRERKAFDFADGVAYIPVEGTLVNKLGTLDPWSGMTGYDGLTVKHREAMADPDVLGILYDIESPGGEVAGLFDFVDLVFESRDANGGKPIWAVASEEAFSAAYAIASAADFVFLPRTGQMGSIGVVTMHVDWSKSLAEDGIEVTLIFAGQHKVDGNPFEPLPDAVRADIQSEVDQVYTLFTETVGRNRRSMDEAAARATDARIYMGQSAIDVGLADGVAPAAEVFSAMVEQLSERPQIAIA